MAEQESEYLAKAIESLEGAAGEYLARRYNNCANHCDYSVFQAAIAALERSSIVARGGEWRHDFVPSEFEGKLIYRRKLYPMELRGTLGLLYNLRETADYKRTMVSRAEADHALRDARRFVATMERGSQR